MLSFLFNLWDSYDKSKKKHLLLEKLEEEQQYLDSVIQEENHKNGDIAINIKNLTIKSPHSLKDSSDARSSEKDVTNEGCCFRRIGVITTLRSDHGTIDNAFFFDINVSLAVSGELNVGSRVEYLAYQRKDSEHIKVVKIEQVIDQYWDEEQPTHKQIEKQIKELRNEKPTYFNTHQRNILGLIIERKRDSILIDTDYKEMNVNLDAVEIDFVPKEGDRVFVCCNVQMDEHFVDKQGEILQEVSVHPARSLKQEKCTVQQVHNDWAVLNDDCYVTFDVLSSGCKLNVGDIVNADMIECERGSFVWRCIKLSIVEEAYVANRITTPPKQPTRTDSQNHIVLVTEDYHCVFSGIGQKRMVDMTITSRCERALRVHSIELLGRRTNRQSSLLDPEQGIPFDLPPSGVHTLHFEVESKHLGESREPFVICIASFKVRRSICVTVCESEEAAAFATANFKANAGVKKSEQPIVPVGGRGFNSRSRYYANQVWSKKGEVVPGVGINTRRRFIANRIGSYEVPERLRSAYLTSEHRNEAQNAVERMFPALRVDLDFANYTQRFQTLLHLEEIEYFINFRNYDRERAHFTRDDEFLSLTIENLSERRPSLVIGDTVRAINPWTGDNRSYDGIIHKVLFDRVLLKFNAGFQQKYNGEDYRLEFYFSRFTFRKQHYAVGRMVKHLGEQFLFPTRIQLRENPQLEIELRADGNMYVRDALCPWYNERLNTVQKRAVCSILRGETQNMPYVIFGPPGTGKTMTLIETILQIFKQLPSARLLVGAPSNSSADLIATRLIDSQVMQPGDFVRLVSQNQIEKDNIPEHLMPFCATVDIAASGTTNDSMIVTESGLKLRCQMKYLGRHRITISTCSTLGNFIQLGFPSDHFTHVLIDESGQCTEPELMIPICQVSQSRGQVVLAGDPHQLQPIVINRYASERDFSVSYLERILQRAPYLKDHVRFPEHSGYDSRLVTKLLYNYRALPSILRAYSELFYDNELLPMVTEQDSVEAVLLRELQVILPKSELRAPMHGAFFYGMRSENKQEPDSPSWYNPLEAQNVFLMTIQLYRRNVKPEQIGIVTPYAKQVKHLRNVFIAADIAMPKIGSVEEFQGQERDIILISTVRSTPNLISRDIRFSLGFVQCPKRMNVAISRARCLMFVFGNPHLLALDTCWRRYIKYCVDNDAYLGCDLPNDFNEDEA